MDDRQISTRQQIEAMVDNQWQRLARAGTWFSGQERVEIAKVAREAQSHDESGLYVLTEVATEAAKKIATEAHTIDQQWVEECGERGLALLPMVELTAIIAQLSAIDTYYVGVGVTPRNLPEPQPGEPSQEEVKGAKLMRGWLPTRGVAGAPNCFSGVAAEADALHEIHGALSLSMPEMMDMNITKGLHRSQIELLAARTSNYNDCFY